MNDSPQCGDMNGWVRDAALRRFGGAVFDMLRAENIGDSEAEWELWQIAERCGLAERVAYDPAVHGELDADPGDIVTVPKKGMV